MEYDYMKQVIRDEINKLYCLFKTTPKLNVKSVKQHIETFADNPTNYKPNAPVTALRAAVNGIITKGKCAWCGASAEKVQESLKTELDKKEYQLSALCKNCQDETFKEVE